VYLLLAGNVCFIYPLLLTICLSGSLFSNHAFISNTKMFNCRTDFVRIFTEGREAYRDQLEEAIRRSTLLALDYW
jgi:hypothetical protein